MRASRSKDKRPKSHMQRDRLRRHGKQLPDEPWAELIADIGYTFGFIIVILGRLQLFTEHTITAVLPVAYAPTPRNLLRLFRLWGIVLLGNVAGAMVAAWYLVDTGALGRMPSRPLWILAITSWAIHSILWS